LTATTAFFFDIRFTQVVRPKILPLNFLLKNPTLSPFETLKMCSPQECSKGRLKTIEKLPGSLIFFTFFVLFVRMHLFLFVKRQSG